MDREEIQQWKENDDEDEGEKDDVEIREGSIIGVQHDRTRGLIHFFKDGKDLGLAFNNQELRSGKLLPFIQIQCHCEL